MKKNKIIIPVVLASTLVLTTILPTFVNASDAVEQEENQLNGEEIFYSLESENRAIEYDVPGEIEVLPSNPLLRANVPVDNSGVTAPKAISGHYLKSSKIVTKSIKVQNQEQAANELAKFIVGLGTGSLGVVGKTVGAVLTILGGSSIVKQLFSGKVGAQYPIKVITYVYMANKPTGTYAGYTIIVVRNATTGKVIQSTRNMIARYGA